MRDIDLEATRALSGIPIRSPQNGAHLECHLATNLLEHVLAVFFDRLDNLVQVLIVIEHHLSR